MSVFVVRLKGSHNQMVGVFFAINGHELYRLVDECTDPHACKWAKLPPGGIYWPRAAPSVPPKDMGQSYFDSAQELTESWHEALYTKGDLRWFNFPDGMTLINGE